MDGEGLLHWVLQRFRLTNTVDGLFAGLVVAIDEVRATLYHALVDELLEGLFLAAHAEVEEELVPEARVDEVTRGMLRTAHVEVDVLPVLVGLRAHEGLRILRVHIAQVVGAGACEARHGVELEGEDGLIVDERFIDHLLRLGVPSPASERCRVAARPWRWA